MLTLDHISKTFNPGTINEKRALDGLSLHLKPGDFVTVIGGNGAGKSTMLNAVAGVWPVDDGRIILDGVDVTAMPEFRRAQYIGRVFQDPMMGTAANMQIEENLALAARRGKKRTLRWGVTNAEREEYHERLKTLGLGLEDRMTAKVGLLSGGQRQRLTIARALVGSPQVLIMDDSASALDFKTDAALRHAIRERSVRGAAEGGLPLTTVIVSQRVSTVRDADMICVLDHGSVAGLGTHDELYASCQLYREICQSQLRREELEGQQGSTVPASAPTAPAPTCSKEGC